MLKDDYISHVSSLEVPNGNAHIEGVNAFLQYLADAKEYDNRIMVYPQQVCYRERKARKGLWKWIADFPLEFDVAASKARRPKIWHTLPNTGSV